MREETHLATEKTRRENVTYVPPSESITELVKTLKQYAAQATIGINRDASTSAMKNAADVFEQVQERVGELLRTLDDEETAT